MGSNRRIQLSCWLFSKTYNRWGKKGNQENQENLKRTKEERGREERNHTENFRSMFFWGLRIRKPFTEPFKASNGENTIQKHLSLISKCQVWKNFGHQPLLSKRLRKGSIYGVPMHLASPPIAIPRVPNKLTSMMFLDPFLCQCWKMWEHFNVQVRLETYSRKKRGTFEILLVWSNELIYHSKNRNRKGASPTI